jgi:hypothetical protein
MQTVADQMTARCRQTRVSKSMPASSPAEVICWWKEAADTRCKRGV